MATTTNTQGYVAPAGAGKVYQALGTTTTLKARAEDTGFACGVIETVFPPQGGVPPHLHRQTDEAIYVLDGEITIQVGDRTVTAPTGTLIALPRGTAHAFHNVSAAPCRLLIWMMGEHGASFETMLDAFDRLPPGPPDMAMLLPILEASDMELVAPPTH